MYFSGWLSFSAVRRKWRYDGEQSESGGLSRQERITDNGASAQMLSCHYALAFGLELFCAWPALASGLFEPP